MKKIALTIISLIISYLAIAGQGGPDKYGYVWMDNLQSGGPVYHWVDIVSQEYRVYGLSDDNFKGPFPISTGPGNDFNYYWYPVDQLWIGSNGYISFSPANLASVFPSIPDSVDNKHNYISALLSDLSFSGTGNPGQCYIKVTMDSVIVSFINVPFYSQNSPYWTGSNTFQIILDKNDNPTTVNYQSQSGTAMTSSDVKAGMENITGTIGLMPFNMTYPSALYTIKYYYPANSTYLVRDGAVRYNGIPFSRGVFVPNSSSNSLNSMVSNMGNVPIFPPFTASGKIKNSYGATLLSSSVSFPDTLDAQDDIQFYFPTSFSPSVAGNYSFVTTLSGVSNDAVANNDSAVQEVVVIDTALSIYTLGFCGDFPDITGISWVDGHGGVGVYFKPLTYPVKITSVQLYILSNPNFVDCIIKIYDDNGPGGAPGTLLDSVMVYSPAAGWVVQTFNFPAVIYSGGFYVGWEMNGLGITMGVDRVAPISHRTYEIIGNAWSEYRDGLTQDFMIRCNVQKTIPQDIGSVLIAHPVNNDTLYAPAQVSFWIKNFGQAPLLNFPVYYKFASQAVVTQNYTSPFLLQGDSILFTFNTLLPNVPNQQGMLCAWTGLLSDADHGNDTSCVFVTTMTASGISSQGAGEEFRVFPNPASDYTDVYYPGRPGATVVMSLKDLGGRLVREESVLSSPPLRISRGNLQPVTYLLQLRIDDKNYVRRLILQ